MTLQFVGQGYDVHRLAEGRPLILGGVTVPHSRGLLGHSDADVLVHAIMDALLGASGNGDIGRQFPDTDGQYAGISSMELLGRVLKLLEEFEWYIVNIDATIVAQEPKLSPYIKEMEGNIARLLKHRFVGQHPMVNIKATTEEGLGFTGRKEAISAMAIASICR